MGGIVMRVLDGVADCAVREPLFESLRLALNYLGEDYAPAYFHGIAGTVFRAGGICPCAPTCTSAMSLQQMLALLGYGCEILPYDEGSADADMERMIHAVRNSIDNAVPSLVWNAFAPCEWGLAVGYDETEKAFYGRVPWREGTDAYEKTSWDKAGEEAGLVGMLAVVIGQKTGGIPRRQAEAAALREAVRHANDTENADKAGGEEWVFLQGKAALRRWADDFARPEKERGPGDAYCLDIYASCHAKAGEFLRAIAADYPGAADVLSDAARLFDQEAACLQRLFPLLTWNSPWGADADRNARARPILSEVYENYCQAIDRVASALPLL